MLNLGASQVQGWLFLNVIYSEIALFVSQCHLLPKVKFNFKNNFEEITDNYSLCTFTCTVMFIRCGVHPVLLYDNTDVKRSIDYYYDDY